MKSEPPQKVQGYREKAESADEGSFEWCEEQIEAAKLSPWQKYVEKNGHYYCSSFGISSLVGVVHLTKETQDEAWNTGAPENSKTTDLEIRNNDFSLNIDASSTDKDKKGTLEVMAYLHGKNRIDIFKSLVKNPSLEEHEMIRDEKTRRKRLEEILGGGKRKEVLGITKNGLYAVSQGIYSGTEREIVIIAMTEHISFHVNKNGEITSAQESVKGKSKVINLLERPDYETRLDEALESFTTSVKTDPENKEENAESATGDEKSTTANTGIVAEIRRKIGF